MKSRHGFVSNSSSSSFVIKNTSDGPLTIADFVIENPQLVKDFNQEYNADYTLGQILISAEERINNGGRGCYYTFPKNSKKTISFGDEDGDFIGMVYDYILRSGGKSKNWEWEFKESLR